ncbi:hypothetical protein ACWDA3_10265 [Nonomuraea rubra]|uniref:hypothetical protein n=1 Tax=Nonomuraea rubra TaxID=46180 RepID=UPI0033EC42D3
MGRHAKPHSPKEQEPQEDSGGDEHRPSKGRHAKDRQRRTPAEPAQSLSGSAG